MKIQPCEKDLKCDILGCENKAKYCFAIKSVWHKNFVFCENCMHEMFDCFSKNIIPKGVEAPFKRNRKEIL